MVVPQFVDVDRVVCLLASRTRAFLASLFFVRSVLSFHVGGQHWGRRARAQFELSAVANNTEYSTSSYNYGNLHGGSK